MLQPKSLLDIKNLITKNSNHVSCFFALILHAGGGCFTFYLHVTFSFWAYDNKYITCSGHCYINKRNESWNQDKCHFEPQEALTEVRHHSQRMLSIKFIDLNQLPDIRCGRSSENLSLLNQIEKWSVTHFLQHISDSPVSFLFVEITFVPTSSSRRPEVQATATFTQGTHCTRWISNAAFKVQWPI